MRRYHHGDLREALVQAATSLIAAEGLDAFSLRRVAALLEVSQSALYSHFRDKDDLLAAVAAVGFERLRECLQEALAQCPAQEFGDSSAARARTVALVRSYITFALAEPAMFGLMFRAPHGGLGNYPVLSTASANCLALVRSSLVHCAQSAGAAESGSQQAELRAAAGWAQVHGLAELLRSRWLEPRLLPATLLDALAELLLEVLRAPLPGLSGEHASSAPMAADDDSAGAACADAEPARGGCASGESLFDRLLAATAS